VLTPTTIAPGGAVLGLAPSALFKGFSASGEDGDDTIDASTIRVRLNADGGDGNETLSGRAGNDTLECGAGDDTVSGGAGDDIIVEGFADVASFVRIRDDVDPMRTLDGDRIYGQDGSDTFRIVNLPSANVGTLDNTIRVLDGVIDHLNGPGHA
jgi:Ca2+-binding RTX toxin-like protein